jgi:serine/threonine protein phosphatase 1
VFLLGNHELALLSFLKGALPFHQFAGLGGIATIRAYLSHAARDVRAEFLGVFPSSHRRFVESCHDFFETPALIVSHCGIDPSNPESRAKVDMAESRHEELFSGEFDHAKLVVCGHYVQTSCLPYVRRNLICLDTGCGTAGGPLTALLLPERTFLQR